MAALRVAAVALTAIASTGCTDWREKVRPGLASGPVQTPVEAVPSALQFGATKASLLARAHYETTAWVVAVDDDFDDGLEEVMPLDVALAWGPLGNPDILETMSFHLARRYVSARWDGEMPLANDVVMQHLSNHHLVFSSEALRAQLEDVEPGELLELEGHLVDIDLGHRKVRTSLSRKDKGNGACEVLFVERAVRSRPGH